MKLNIEKDYAIGLFIENGIKEALSAEDRKIRRNFLMNSITKLCQMEIEFQNMLL